MSPTRIILAAALLVPSGMAQSKYVNDVLALSPLGYWRLNGNANDATSHADNGTLMNGVGSLGQLHFSSLDGTARHVRLRFQHQDRRGRIEGFG
jgi:hypothetical protein